MLCLKKKHMRCVGQSHFEEAGMSVKKGRNELTGAHASLADMT
jgi:hypothetical protein